jgi:hypothetical protein
MKPAAWVILAAIVGLFALSCYVLVKAGLS